MRHSRRGLVAAVPLLLVLGLTAACGGSDSQGLGLDSVSFSGKVGQEPKVTFDGQVTDPTQQTKVLVDGTGPVIKTGDQVVVQQWLGNGYTQKVASDTYADHSPQLVPINGKVNPIFLKAIQGQHLGSRVVISTEADKVYGQVGNPNLQIGNKDVVVIMFDLISTLKDGPDGTAHKAPSWAPTFKKTKGTLSGFGFAGTPQPNGTLRQATLDSGTGPVVTKGQTIWARYLGQVYGAKKPFDENYSKDPISSRIGVGAVVKGWDQVLVGKKVGSRVLMALPPKLGYGKAGNSQAGVKGTDTLYFVVEILAAA
ncbi:MAG: FKBP-type peptidyl-prolyl cis-trans isomerase [Nocardioides sp.]